MGSWVPAAPRPWRAASGAAASVNAFTAAAGPGREAGYFCRSNRKKPTGKRKSLTHALELGLGTRGSGTAIKGFSLCEWPTALSLAREFRHQSRVPTLSSAGAARRQSCFWVGPAGISHISPVKSISCASAKPLSFNTHSQHCKTPVPWVSDMLK